MTDCRTMIPHNTRRYAFPAVLAPVLALIFLSPAAFGQDEEAASPAQQLEQLMTTGQEQLASEDYEAALQTYADAIKVSGGQSVGAYLGRAAARKGLKEYATALEDIKNAQQALFDDPTANAQAKRLSGEIYLELGALGEALADLQEAAELLPDDPGLQFSLGKAMVLAGGAEQGKEALDKWLESGSDDEEKNAEAYRLKAQASAMLSRYDEALADVDSSLKINPDDHETYALKGFILALQENYEEAAEVLKTAIEKYEPEEGSDLPYTVAHLRRASALEEAAKQAAGDENKQLALFTEARDEVQRLLDALPDRPELARDRASALYTLGVNERMIGDLGEAVKSFSEAIDINPAMAPAYFRRGICFFHMGEERLAIKDFDKAAGLDFESPHAALWKGRTYAQLGEYYEALRAYSEAIAVSDRYTDAYMNRGLTYVKLGNYPAAIEDFDDAIRLQPSNANLYYYRGVVYQLQGDYKRAIRSLATAIDYDDQLAGAYLHMADALSAIGQSGLASDYRTKGRELSGQVSH
ncbi:MAG: tetratricopeptide repeat protein [Planctomycetales bacterium]|nr:tetratricopeptide repeat protein [Planctomycetales bacterium]